MVLDPKNNKKSSCREHFSRGLDAGQRCTVWNGAPLWNWNQMECPTGGAVGGICSGGDKKCWSQNEWLSAAADCRGVDQTYFLGSSTTTIAMGHDCPENSVLVGTTNQKGRNERGHCRKLIPGAFDDRYPADTVHNIKQNGPTWTSGAVPTGWGSSVGFCPGSQLATSTNNTNLKCQALKPLQGDFVATASENHF